MKALILYMSRHGSTEKIAQLLQKHLPVPADLLRLHRVAPKLDLQPYDLIIIGGSVYMNEIQTEVKAFCQTHQQELLEKQLGLFICCMNDKNPAQTLKAAFPEALLQHASVAALLGGELQFDKMSLLEKMIILSVTGQKESVSKLKYAAIEQFAEALAAEKVAG